MNFYTSSLLLTSVASLLLGLFVFLKGKNKSANITLALLSFGVAFWTLGQFMGEMVGSKAAVLLWTREGLASAVFIPAFFVHFILALIDRAGQEKKLLRLAYGLAFGFLLLDFTPLFVADVQPLLSFRFYPVPGIVYPFFAVFLFACFVYAFYRLFTSYVQAYGEKRNQQLYVIVASVIGFLGGITTFFPIWGVNLPVVAHLILPLYLLVLVYTILKHRLLDISIIVREGLVYSALTLLFAGFYVFLVLVANYYLARFVEFSPLATILIVVFVSVLIFQPLRQRIQGIVDRIFFQGEYRYQKTIADLSAENRKLFRSLLQADKLASLGTLSAGMAHEIKNPLASIKGMTQVLDENLDDPEFIKKYQDVLGRQIDRINNLVEQLLKAGQPQKLALSKFNVNQIIDNVLALVENECRKKDIAIEKNLKELPQIKGDEEQLAQVFTNLFLNAVQAMSDGGILAIKAQRRGPDSVQIEVRDTGLGIPADKLGSVFDPFFTTKEQGTGLGLAVVYRIIKEHNGEINVESEEGKGANFTIWLPIRPEQSV
ncbi:MAG: ATP-binding protein [bacterium]